MKQSIRTKIIAANILVILPLLFLLNILILNFFEQYTLRRTMTLLDTASYTVQLEASRYLSQNLNPIGNDLYFLNNELSQRTGTRIQLYYLGDGQELFFDSTHLNAIYDFTLETDEGINLAIQGKKSYIVRQYDGMKTILLSFPINRVDELVGAAQLIYPLEQEYLSIEGLRWILIVVSTSIFLGIIIILLILTNKIVSPLINLKNRIASFQIEQEFSPPNGTPVIKDEVYDISVAFNEMAAHMKELIDSLKEEQLKQKDFYDNMTHELRTPLTTILGYSDVLKKIHTTDVVEQSADTIQQEARRLLRLVNELLENSKMSFYEIKIEKRWANAKQIVEQVVDIMNYGAKKSGVTLRVTEIEEVWAYFDEDKIAEVVLNLIDNALKHSGSNRVEVSLTVDKAYIHITVKDYGIGISKIDDWQSGEIKTINHTRGRGMGLNICRHIIEKHDGRFVIASNNQGTQATVSLPRE